MRGRSQLRDPSVFTVPCMYSHTAIACLVSDNRWLDIIKLISVIKEVPLPKLGHAGILPAWDRKRSVSFSMLHFHSVIIPSRYLATYASLRRM